MELLKAENEYITVKSHRSSSDIDHSLLVPNVKIFLLKQRHEANELKTCHTAFNFFSVESHQTISNLKIESNEIRCKISLFSKIIEPNLLVDILTK